MAYQIFLRLDKTLLYKLGNFTNFSINENSPVSPMPLPEETSEENLLVKIEGNSCTISLSWLLINEPLYMCGTQITKINNQWSIEQVGGLNQANSGNPSRTPVEQMQLLSHYIPSSINNTYYAIYVMDDSWASGLYDADQVAANANPLWRGTWQGISFTFDANNPVNITANLNFIRGDNVISLAGNVPEKPVIKNITNPSTKQLIVEVQEWKGYQNENDRPKTTKATLHMTKNNVSYIKHSDDFTVEDQTVPYNITFNNVETGYYTDIKIRLWSDIAYGKYSDYWTVNQVKKYIMVT